MANPKLVINLNSPKRMNLLNFNRFSREANLASKEYLTPLRYLDQILHPLNMPSILLHEDRK